MSRIRPKFRPIACIGLYIVYSHDVSNAFEAMIM